MHVLDWTARREQNDSAHGDMIVTCLRCGQWVRVDVQRSREHVQQFMDAALPTCMLLATRTGSA